MTPDGAPEDIQRQLKMLKARWAEQAAQEAQDERDYEKRLRARIRQALLEGRFLPPCDCDICLTGLLEESNRSCRLNYNSYPVLYHSAFAQHV